MSETFISPKCVKQWHWFHLPAARRKDWKGSQSEWRSRDPCLCSVSVCCRPSIEPYNHNIHSGQKKWIQLKSFSLPFSVSLKYYCCGWKLAFYDPSVYCLRLHEIKFPGSRESSSHNLTLHIQTSSSWSGSQCEQAVWNYLQKYENWGSTIGYEKEERKGKRIFFPPWNANHCRKNSILFFFLFIWDYQTSSLWLQTHIIQQ